MRLLLSAVVLMASFCKTVTAAEITTSEFFGDSDSVTWTEDTDISEYYVYVGYTAGSDDVANSGSLDGSSESYAVTGLPADGTVLSVRLWQYNGRRWSYVDVSVVSSASVEEEEGTGQIEIDELLNSVESVETLMFAGLLMCSGALGISAGLKR